MQRGPERFGCLRSFEATLVTNRVSTPNPTGRWPQYYRANLRVWCRPRVPFVLLVVVQKISGNANRWRSRIVVRVTPLKDLATSERAGSGGGGGVGGVRARPDPDPPDNRRCGRGWVLADSSDTQERCGCGKRDCISFCCSASLTRAPVADRGRHASPSDRVPLLTSGAAPLVLTPIDVRIGRSQNSAG